MSACRIVNQSVVEAVGEIKNISEKCRSAGEDFIRDLNNALSEMEGEAKDQFKAFIDTDVNEFVGTSIPEAIRGMSELLEANRTNFVDTDKALADGISGN
ncbi:MAG: hypothetical protein IJ567_07810 [Lachnospiraceae bacterium]|nr:hypothetical protein [Lachnospiraceae bacterium]